MILLHNLADSIPATAFGGAAWIWNVIHQQGLFRVGPVMVIAAYPLVAWIGVMAAGFCFGRIMVLEPEQQRAWTFRNRAGADHRIPGVAWNKCIWRSTEMVGTAFRNNDGPFIFAM